MKNFEEQKQNYKSVASLPKVNLMTNNLFTNLIGYIYKVIFKTANV